MRLNKWSDIEASFGRLTLPIKVGRSIGYLEVFENLDEMKKEYPKEEAYLEIEETVKK